MKLHCKLIPLNSFACLSIVVLLCSGCASSRPAIVVDRSPRLERLPNADQAVPERTDKQVDLSTSPSRATSSAPPNQTPQPPQIGKQETSGQSAPEDASVEVTPLKVDPQAEASNLPADQAPLISEPRAIKVPYTDAIYFAENETGQTEVGPTLWNGMHWLWPTVGKVFRQFGAIPGIQGIEISGIHQQPVHATSDGKVVYVGEGLKAYGKLVVIRHNSSYISVYGNNQMVLVREGEQVRIGQRIASMGKDQNGRGKLIFEIRHGGKSIDPSSFMSPNPDSYDG